jgi:hypothetical protein
MEIYTEHLVTDNRRTAVVQAPYRMWMITWRELIAMHMACRLCYAQAE